LDLWLISKFRGGFSLDTWTSTNISSSPVQQADICDWTQQPAIVTTLVPTWDVFDLAFAQAQRNKNNLTKDTIIFYLKRAYDI
jgi:hypothetical protein